ncbi:uncharacterized protein EI90DRAFT_826205 [Cantharellus anzutake]|uniref:uncharacterized protein n=1 Tax=Cantharellus anzutake TaxID=1750568 RepID=UPI001904C90D|nr:uncharacterized protein EI90DRAFT_826205 [Cantharellus anzutake]KAF8343071.1 hypothetical protein EI90DRAFT_826205 [Cantharellus anzutake]
MHPTPPFLLSLSDSDSAPSPISAGFYGYMLLAQQWGRAKETMLTTPRGPNRWACSTCKKGKHKCSPHQDITGKCERCARLRKECTRSPSKNPQSTNALAVEASSPAHTSSHGTSERNSVVPANQSLPPPPRQGTNPFLNLLKLVSSRGRMTIREVHDSALDRGIEWAAANFGGFDARAFRMDCSAVTHADRHYPVRACHWALLLRQFCSDRMLSKEEAEMFVSDVLRAWFDDLRFGTRWTLDAISILLKHLRETGDIRSKFGGVE